MIPSAYPWGKGTPVQTRDATANDSMKDWTVPDGKIRKLLWIYVSLVTTADVGDRTIQLQLTDGTNFTFVNQSPSTQAASLTYRYLMSPSVPNVTVVGTTVCMNMPETILTAGCRIYVGDVATIAPAADDMTVVLHYIEYDA